MNYCRTLSGFELCASARTMDMLSTELSCKGGERGGGRASLRLLCRLRCTACSADKLQVP